MYVGNYIYHMYDVIMRRASVIFAGVSKCSESLLLPLPGCDWFPPFVFPLLLSPPQPSAWNGRSALLRTHIAAPSGRALLPSAPVALFVYLTDWNASLGILVYF